MNKSGIVLQIDKKIACLMTSDGQFIKVKVKDKIPQKGEIYTGEVYNSLPLYRTPLIAALMSFFIFLSGGMYTYYTPAAELTISINPSIKIILNRWNRIIKSAPLNNDGKKILSSVKLSNRKLDEGLDLIVDQAKTDNFINEEYTESGKFISVHINEDKTGSINLDNFEESIKKQNLSIEVVNDSKSKSLNKEYKKNTETENDKNKDNKTKNTEAEKQQDNNKDKDKNNKQTNDVKDDMNINSNKDVTSSEKSIPVNKNNNKSNSSTKAKQNKVNEKK